MALNQDVLYDIFSWLPAKLAYKFSLVSKPCNEFLLDKTFVSRQCKHMQFIGDTDLLIQSKYNRSNLEIHACNSHNDSNLPSEETLDLLLKIGMVRVVASSKGLLCCRDTEKKENPLFIINPTTRKYSKIPLPDRSTMNSQEDFNIVFHCEKGHHDQGRDNYFLLTFVSSDYLLHASRYRSKIYSSVENTWKDCGEIDLGGKSINFKNSIYQNGMVYLISEIELCCQKSSPDYWPYIVAYDTKNLSLRFLEIPIDAKDEDNDDPRLEIFKWGEPNGSYESICLVKLTENNVFSFWVLESNKSCWKRLPVDLISTTSDPIHVEAFTLMNGRDLLFATDEKVYCYNVLDGMNGVLEEVCSHGCGYPVCLDSFSSTLRPCGPGEIRI